MTGTRYCSTCGTLLSEGAAICGECGARYQPSPYERRATDAPGAWSPPPRQRSRETDIPAGAAEEEGIELITADSLRPARPGATALRGEEQYDRVMVTQPPMNQPGPPVGAPGAPGSPARAPEPGPTDQPAAAPLDPPLDGCVTASPLKRFLAALIDSVLASLVSVPFLVGAGLLLFSEDPGLLAQILIGVGVALPLAYHLVMVWLVGAKGFTIGKLILGLRVTRTSQGGPLGFLRSLGRWALYGLISLIMALSIFLDPRKQLRGFHDRAVDSVVVDVKEGRDPLKPRPDDFERAGAEHYLGAPSVAVGAHENLLAEPGAAWRDQGAGPAQPADGGAPQHGAPPQGMPPQGAPEQGAPQQGAPQQGAPSPYAPHTSASSAAEAPASPWGSPSAAPQGTDGGWAPPPVEPIPSPPSSWDEPAAPAQPTWDQGPAQDPWDRPEQQALDASWGPPEAQHQAPSWDAPAAQEPAPTWGSPPEAPQEPAPTWGAPSAAPQDPAPSWGSPAPQEPAPSWGGQPVQEQSPWGPSPAAPVAPAPAGTPAPTPTGTTDDQHGGPNDLTGDAWGEVDDSVDEATRMSVAEDLGDLEATRISTAHLPPVKKVRLTTDDGAERIVDKAVVVGRNPAAPGEELLFVMRDETRSVSKTHLRVDGTGEELVVTDLGSTNGSTILREDGSRENLVPETPTVLPAGARVTLGDRTLSVERVQ
jgi:uncharacterized RDD family membrane protein YckC